jgi:hypothetical protein
MSRRIENTVAQAERTFMQQSYLTMWQIETMRSL